MKANENKVPDCDHLIDFKEVASRLGGISIRSVYRLIAKHDLPNAVHVLSKPCLYASDITAYLDKLKGKRVTRA